MLAVAATVTPADAVTDSDQHSIPSSFSSTFPLSPGLLSSIHRHKSVLFLLFQFCFTSSTSLELMQDTVVTYDHHKYGSPVRTHSAKVASLKSTSQNDETSRIAVLALHVVKVSYLSTQLSYSRAAPHRYYWHSRTQPPTTGRRSS